jgi:hypothetical protein
VHPRGFRIGNTTVGATFAQPDAFRVTYTPAEYSYQNFQTGKDMVYNDPNGFLAMYEYSTRRKFDPNAEAPVVDEDEAFLQSLDAEKNASAQQASNDKYEMTAARLLFE